MKQCGELFAVAAEFEEQIPAVIADHNVAVRLFGGEERAMRVQMHGAVAVVSVEGMLVRYRSGYLANYPELCERLAELQADDAVAAVVLNFDTPGGHAMGIADACDAIKAFTKPILSHVSGYCASGGYWLAAYTDKIFAAQQADVGSIGARFSLIDASKQFEKEGVRKIDVVSTPFKAVGSYGAEVTDEHIAYMQERCDQIHAEFMSALAERGLTGAAAAAVATGKIYRANSPQGAQLVDGIASLEQVIEMAARQVAQVQAGQPPQTKGLSMADTQQPAASAASTEETQQPLATPPAAPQPTAATLPELKAACPNASSDFLLAQLEAGATVNAAQTAFILHLQQQKPASTPPTAGTVSGDGVQADNGTVATGTGDVVADYEDRIAAVVQECGGDRRRAMRQLVRMDPEAHQRYREALANMATADIDARRRRLIGNNIAAVK